MVFRKALTKFGSVENPFIEENDTGAQGDPCSAAKQLACVSSSLPVQGYLHHVETWV